MTVLLALTIFYYLLISVYYINMPLLQFDEICPILNLRVGNGVGKKRPVLRVFTEFFQHACGEEQGVFPSLKGGS